MESYLCGYVDQSALARVETGDLAVARIRVRNLGTATWRRDGAHPLLLGSAAPSGLFVEGAWIGPDRPARPRESAVGPGQVATFEFALRAPPVPGLHQVAVRPVVEGLTWLNDLGLSVGLDVRLPERDPGHGLAAEVVLAPPPLLLRPGGRGEVVVRLRNSGRVRWTDQPGDGEPQVLLGTAEPLDRPGRFHTPGAWVAPNRAAHVRGVVLPGQSVDLAVAVTAPTEPGEHAERYRLVGEGVSWFDGAPIEVRVLVV